MRTVLALLAIALVSVPAAQIPVPPPPAARRCRAGHTYSYQPEGRRDPFLNLLAREPTRVVDGKRMDGAAGLTVARFRSGLCECRAANAHRDGSGADTGPICFFTRATSSLTAS